MVKYDCTTDAGLRAALADTNVPMIGRRFGSLHASLVARYLDSRTAVRLLRKTAKRCSPPGALRLWTFDCCNEQQANELASEVDRNAVIVVRVHWSLQSCNLPPPLDGYFRNCESICLVGFPRYLDAALFDVTTIVGQSSIRFMPEGSALTARDGWAAVFAEAPAAPQGVTRHFRLQVNDVSRTFFSTFEDGQHGSSNFCALDDGACDTSRQMLAGPFVDRQFDGLVGGAHVERIRRQAGNAGSDHSCAKQTLYCFHCFFPLVSSFVQQLYCHRWIFVDPCLYPAHYFRR